MYPQLSYYYQHKAYKLEYQKKYYEQNKEAISKYYKNYYQKKKTKVKEKIEQPKKPPSLCIRRGHFIVSFD